LDEAGPLYSEEVYQQFKKNTNNRNVIKRNLDSLIEKGYVKREKKGKYVYYSITFIGMFQKIIYHVLQEEILYSLVYDGPQRFSKIVRQFRHLTIDTEDIRRILKNLIEENLVEKGKWGKYFATISDYETTGIKQLRKYLDSIKPMEVAKYYTENISDEEIKFQLKKSEKELYELGLKKENPYYALAQIKYYLYQVKKEYKRPNFYY